MLFAILAQANNSPDACFMTGFCGLNAEPPSVAPGVFFLALGMILTGTMGLWHTRRRRPE